MQCSEFVQFLEQEPDGALPAPATDHLEACSRCRLLLSDLEEIRVAGLEWVQEEPEPSPRVWLALRAQLQSEGLIRKPEPARPSVWTGWLQTWALRPAVVGVSLPVLLVAIALLQVQANLPATTMSDSLPVASASTASAPAALSADVDQTLDSDMRRVMASLPSRSPSLARALQTNLTIVDNMIATCEKSVREQPDNPMVREYLYGAYQQKAVLLSAAMERTTLEVR